MNTFMNGLNNTFNYGRTTNGALAHKSTNSAVYDMFALGGAYQNKSEGDKILLFKNAYDEDHTLALKCLFYLRDVRGGQGRRDFFRTCYHWLIPNDREAALRNMKLIPEYGRWDDLIYITYNTPIFKDAMAFVKEQLTIDLYSKTPSLLAKWLPSANASAAKTKELAIAVRNSLGLTPKQYRKILSTLRERIKVVEKLMSENRWNEIEFDKIPSKAGLIYRNAFARRDILAKKYEAFVKDNSKKVNAGALYPYEIVRKALDCHTDTENVNRLAINKYWENLPDYFCGKASSLMCVVDTSGSMSWSSNNGVYPIDVAISLGMYCGERLNGPFKGNYISFSRNPKLIKIEGVDFVDKVKRIYRQNLCENTNLCRVFDLLKNIALTPGVRKEDIPKTIVVISDMQIDASGWRTNTTDTEMEAIRRDWAMHGLKLPRLVYWNVNASGEANILDAGKNVSYVSGFSPSIFSSILTGKNGYDLMLEVLNGKRYTAIK